MDGISCDMCGRGLLLDSNVRYEVKIQVQAAYDPMEITQDDLERDLRAEIEEALKRASAMTKEEAEASVYQSFRFDLCPPCRRLYARSPLKPPFISAPGDKLSPPGPLASEDKPYLDER